MDLIGPLPTTPRGNKYVVILVDYFSKWPEAAPLKDKSAKGVALFLYHLFYRQETTIPLVNDTFCVSFGEKES